MKIILRILIILSIALLVCGALYLALNNSSAGSAPDGAPEFDRTQAMPEGEIGERPEGGGDHDAASLERGLPELLTTLAKISGITVVVVLAQTTISFLKKRRPFRNFMAQG